MRIRIALELHAPTPPQGPLTGTTPADYVGRIHDLLVAGLEGTGVTVTAVTHSAHSAHTVGRSGLIHPHAEPLDDTDPTA